MLWKRRDELIRLAGYPAHSPESRATVMRLPDSAFWLFIAPGCVLIALSFFLIQLSHYQG